MQNHRITVATADGRGSRRDRRAEDIHLSLGKRERRLRVERRLPIVEEGVSFSDWAKYMAIFQTEIRERTGNDSTARLVNPRNGEVLPSNDPDRLQRPVFLLRGRENARQIIRSRPV